jgi:PilZ domain
MKRRRHGAITGVCDNGIPMLPVLTPTIETERRLKIRYPVRLPVCYRTIGSSQQLAGVGHTLNLSSSGLLVQCQHALRAGMRVEVTLEWPSLLDATIPLQLVTVGRIVRAQGSTCGIAFSQYQFRTMRRKQSLAPREPVELVTASTKRILGY